jgi:hypothetical protein
MWKSKTLQIQRTLQNYSRVLELQSPLPNKMGYNVHDVLRKKICFLYKNFSLRK